MTKFGLMRPVAGVTESPPHLLSPPLFLTSSSPLECKAVKKRRQPGGAEGGCWNTSRGVGGGHGVVRVGDGGPAAAGPGGSGEQRNLQSVTPLDSLDMIYDSSRCLQNRRI